MKRMQGLLRVTHVVAVWGLAAPVVSLAGGARANALAVMGPGEPENYGLIMALVSWDSRSGGGGGSPLARRRQAQQNARSPRNCTARWTSVSSRGFYRRNECGPRSLRAARDRTKSPVVIGY